MKYINTTLILFVIMHLKENTYKLKSLAKSDMKAGILDLK